jgi:septum formation protein
MPAQSQFEQLILASGSPYRSLLFQRLNLPFEVHSPDIDESPMENESPLDLVRRLADQKSAAVAGRFPAALVIGSDQVAVCGERIVGKPGNAARARKQLRDFSGQSIVFHTAVTVRCEATGFFFEHTVDTEVRFRQLGEAEIERYVKQENPIDCAGSFKSEAAGICLLQGLVSNDPTAIIGLPLIAVSEALRLAGFPLP